MAGESEILNALPEDVVEDESIFRTKRGLIFDLHPVARMVVVDASRKLPQPKVPVYMNPDKEREEENPADPTYRAALREWNMKQGLLAISVYLTLGTSINFLPDGIDRVEDTEWAETLTELGLDIPVKGRARYLCWMKYYALTDQELDDLVAKVMHFSGLVTEEDANKAAESFPGADQGGANNLSLVTT